MAIYGIGAYYDEDVSQDFIKRKIIGCGWSEKDAPEISILRSLKVGDIVYLKSFSPSSEDLIIKGIGIIVDDVVIEKSSIVQCGRNVRWFLTEEFRIKKPHEKYNVRNNTIYEEYNLLIQRLILKKIIGDL